MSMGVDFELTRVDNKGVLIPETELEMSDRDRALWESLIDFESNDAHIYWDFASNPEGKPREELPAAQLTVFWVRVVAVEEEGAVFRFPDIVLAARERYDLGDRLSFWFTPDQITTALRELVIWPIESILFCAFPLWVLGFSMDPETKQKTLKVESLFNGIKVTEGDSFYVALPLNA